MAWTRGPGCESSPRGAVWEGLPSAARGLPREGTHPEPDAGGAGCSPPVQADAGGAAWPCAGARGAGGGPGGGGSSHGVAGAGGTPRPPSSVLGPVPSPWLCVSCPPCHTSLHAEPGRPQATGASGDPNGGASRPSVPSPHPKAAAAPGQGLLNCPHRDLPGWRPWTGPRGQPAGLRLGTLRVSCSLRYGCECRPLPPWAERHRLADRHSASQPRELPHCPALGPGWAHGAWREAGGAGAAPAMTPRAPGPHRPAYLCGAPRPTTSGRAPPLGGTRSCPSAARRRW